MPRMGSAGTRLGQESPLWKDPEWLDRFVASIVRERGDESAPPGGGGVSFVLGACGMGKTAALKRLAAVLGHGGGAVEPLYVSAPALDKSLLERLVARARRGGAVLLIDDADRLADGDLAILVDLIETAILARDGHLVLAGSLDAEERFKRASGKIPSECQTAYRLYPLGEEEAGSLLDRVFHSGDGQDPFTVSSNARAEILRRAEGAPGRLVCLAKAACGQARSRSSNLVKLTDVIAAFDRLGSVDRRVARVHGEAWSDLLVKVPPPEEPSADGPALPESRPEPLRAERQKGRAVSKRLDTMAKAIAVDGPDREALRTLSSGAKRPAAAAGFAMSKAPEAPRLRFRRLAGWTGGIVVAAATAWFALVSDAREDRRGAALPESETQEGVRATTSGPIGEDLAPLPTVEVSEVHPGLKSSGFEAERSTISPGYSRNDEVPNSVVERSTRPEPSVDRATAPDRPSVAPRPGLKRPAEFGRAQHAALTRRDAQGSTPLIRAAKAAQSEEVRRLLGQGANPDQWNDQQTTALMYAAWNGDEASVEVLLAAGADPHLGNRDGRTALMAAVMRGELAIVERLLDAGVAVDALGLQNTTALMYAAAVGHRKVVARLLAAGADPNLRNSQGMSAVDFAERRGTADTIRMLQGAESIR